MGVPMDRCPRCASEHPRNEFCSCTTEDERKAWWSRLSPVSDGEGERLTIVVPENEPSGAWMGRVVPDRGHLTNDNGFRERQRVVAQRLFEQYAGKAVGTLEEAQKAFVETVAPFVIWDGVEVAEPTVLDVRAIRSLLEQRPAINITLGESSLTDSMLASFLANKSGVGRS